MSAGLVGGWSRRTQFWKGTIQGPFLQSLVRIGQAVSDKKIFQWFFAEFSILATAAILVGRRGHSTKFWKGTTQDHIC